MEQPVWCSLQSVMARSLRQALKLCQISTYFVLTGLVDTSKLLWKRTFTNYSLIYSVNLCDNGHKIEFWCGCTFGIFPLKWQSKHRSWSQGWSSLFFRDNEQICSVCTGCDIFEQHVWKISKIVCVDLPFVWMPYRAFSQCDWCVFSGFQTYYIKYTYIVFVMNKHISLLTLWILKLC